MRGMRTILVIAYVVIGVIIASNRNYLSDLDTLKRVVSALLAVLLWPLVLLGVDVRV